MTTQTADPVSMTAPFGAKRPPGVSPSAGTSLAAEYLGDLVNEGVDATGGQLSVIRLGDTQSDAAFGQTMGRPMEVGHLHSGFCVTKPLLGLVAGHLMDRHGLELDGPFQSRLMPETGTLTLAAVLNHSAGLSVPSGLQWRVSPPAIRDELLASTERTEGPAYSEVAAGLIIEELITATTSSTPGEFVTEEILVPLGIENDMVVDGRRAVDESIHRRTSVPLAGLPDRCLPMLSDRLHCQLAEIRPAFGSLVNARGLCRLFGAVGRCLGGEDVDGLPRPETLTRLTAAIRGSVTDAVLRKRCDFAGGFMVGLSQHGFGYLCSPSAVGHVGAMGHSVALYDPGQQLAAAFYLNGCKVGLDARDEGIRTAVVDRLLGGQS